MNDNNEEYLPVDSAAEEGTVVAEGPGRYLREAREAQQLTQQQVAAELRMQVRTIEALEADDYQSLPGTTFVQGYLRSYARLLGLDEAAIVSMGQRSSMAGDAELRSVYETSEQMSSSDLPVRMVSYLVVLAAVVGLAWWLAQKIPSGDGETAPPELGSSSTEQLLPMQAELDGQPEQEKLEIAGDSVGEGSGSGEAAAEGPVGELGVPGADSSLTVAAEGQPLQQEPAAPAGGAPVGGAVNGPAGTEQNDTSLVMPSAVNADAPPPLRDDMPQSRIELEYQADSWTEISDAAGRQLVYSLVPAGRNLVLRGEAPFKVFLGYAPGVNVYFNGDLYDHGPYQRGDVARFRIGRAEHNQPLTGN